MNIDERLNALVHRARDETPPAVDVADRVLWILSTPLHPVFRPERLWMWMAGLSSMVAASVLATAFLYFNVWNDPFTEVLETISWVIQ